MKRRNFLRLLLFAATLLSCSIVKHQKKGDVYPVSFNSEIEFATKKSVIILPVKLNGAVKNFLFDTGADYSLIQRDSLIGKVEKIKGASKRKMKLGTEMLASMKINDVNFRNTIALNGDMIGLKEKIPNFGGLIGQPIIKKANWLINYPEKKIRISNHNLVDSSFKTIEIKREGGAPYTNISINGFLYKAIIDLGSSSALNLPKESKLAKLLLKQYDFEHNERERYTLGGSQNITEKKGILPLVKLGTVDFENVQTTINTSSQLRVGIAFFKDCQIYIDNIDNTYKIKK